LVTILNLLRNERPLLFFSMIASMIFLLAGGLAVPIIIEYARSGLVPRFPTAILCSALAVVGVVAIATGLILDLVAHVRREGKLLAYLHYPAPDDNAADQFADPQP
jgi:hypothetical protein